MNLIDEPLFGITLGWFPIALIWLPLCVWILVRVGKRIATGPSKSALLGGLALLMAAIPLADDAYIQWHFNRLCRDAGLHYEKKLLVDGFYDSTMRSGYHLVEVTGFRFAEHPSNSPGKVERVEMVDGEWLRTELDGPTARYHLIQRENHKRIGFRLKKFEQVVVDSKTGKEVIRLTDYWRYPGWLDGIWLGFFDRAGRQCVQSRTPPLLSVIEPISKREGKGGESADNL
jgi:hypothetical protein